MPRFQPGQSGNPKGRPKRSITSLLRQNADIERITKIILDKAMRGEKWALEVVLSRLDPVENALTLKHKAVKSSERASFDLTRLSGEQLEALYTILASARDAGPDGGRGGNVPAIPAPLPGSGMADS